MAIVNANQLVLRASTTAPSNALSPTVAHAQNASLSFSNSLIDTTTKSSNSWMQKISGQRSFTLSADGLLGYAAVSGAVDVVGGGGSGTLSALALSGAEIFFQFGIGNQGYSGSGFISSFEQSGGTDDAPTYSISIEGNGVLTFDDDFTS